MAREYGFIDSDKEEKISEKIRKDEKDDREVGMRRSRGS
jgi:hypothetical protein